MKRHKLYMTFLGNRRIEAPREYHRLIRMYWPLHVHVYLCRWIELSPNNPQRRKITATKLLSFQTAMSRRTL